VHTPNDLDLIATQTQDIFGFAASMPSHINSSLSGKLRPDCATEFDAWYYQVDPTQTSESGDCVTKPSEIPWDELVAFPGEEHTVFGIDPGQTHSLLPATTASDHFEFVPYPNQYPGPLPDSSPHHPLTDSQHTVDMDDFQSFECPGHSHASSEAPIHVSAKSIWDSSPIGLPRETLLASVSSGSPPQQSVSYIPLSTNALSTPMAHPRRPNRTSVSKNNSSGPYIAVDFGVTYSAASYSRLTHGTKNISVVTNWSRSPSSDIVNDRLETEGIRKTARAQWPIPNDSKRLQSIRQKSSHLVNDNVSDGQEASPPKCASKMSRKLLPVQIRQFLDEIPARFRADINACDLHTTIPFASLPKVGGPGEDSSGTVYQIGIHPSYCLIESRTRLSSGFSSTAEDSESNYKVIALLMIYTETR
jgi:hypothetical protein